MEKLLVILFLIKLYALKNIFNIIGGKHGQNSLTMARNMERTRIKIAKVKADIKFLLVCKRNNLRPTFARPKFAVNLGPRIDHIATKLSESEIKTEFEAFFYGLNKQLGHLSTTERDELKTKIRRTCENYYKIKNNNKVEETINKLSKNKNI